jgi:pre-mRNA-processing factor 40
MAGRGKDAVLPAWMKQGTGGPAAPGSGPGPKPSVPALARSAAPGTTISSSVSRSVTGIASHWTEHTAPNGRKYYYNSLLGKSSWGKPDELKTAEEKALTGSLSSWKQFTAPDGRKYYYNSTTKQSSWEPPPELTVGTQVAPLQVDSSITAATAAAGVGGSAGLSKSVYTVPQGAIQSGPTPHYSTVAEAKEAFRTMLHDAAIPSLLSWEDTVLLLAGDKRFGALKTVGERKAAFNEYIQHRRKEEAEVARAKQVKVRLNVGNVVKTMRPVMSPLI